MKKLTFEKEETITGVTVYKVFFGIDCLSTQEEVGSNAQIATNGKSVAYNRARDLFEECYQRSKNGYPKSETILSADIQG